MMSNKALPLPKIQLLELASYHDERGIFSVIFEQNQHFDKLNFHLVQINESLSYYGVIRGLHAQQDPYSQAKIIRVLSGKILDVVIDIRPNSPEFGKMFSIKLTEKSKQLLYIPKGFLHGFSVLSQQALVQYFVDEIYKVDKEIGIRYDDPQFKINWLIPHQDQIISEKDLALPYFNNLF